MSNSVEQLNIQLKQIKKGLFMMGPDRVRAMSTHETEDLIVELQTATDKALAELATLKSD
jgi:ribosomal protein L29